MEREKSQWDRCKEGMLKGVIALPMVAHRRAISVS